MIDDAKDAAMAPYYTNVRSMQFDRSVSRSFLGPSVRSSVRRSVRRLYRLDGTGARSFGPSWMSAASVDSLTGPHAHASTPTLIIRPR